MTKVETIFAYELSLIHDKDIKQFVIDCFDKFCPDYFWTCPCSTTGKYHPKVSLGVGGLVRHTKLAVWWGIELAKALDDSPELRGIPQNQLHDEIIATLLLHDMIKNGKGLNAQGYPLEKGVTGTHGVTLAKKMLDLDVYIKGAENPYGRILAGIAGHMGIWTTDVNYRPENMESPERKVFAQLIHLADYCASRKVNDIYRKLQGEQDKLLDDVGTLPPGVLSVTITEKEKTDAAIKQTANKNEVSQSPACSGVRPIESRQTTEADSQ